MNKHHRVQKEGTQKKHDTKVAGMHGQPRPCPADNMPDFRVKFPKPSMLNDNGIRNLKTAIIARAAQDYYDVCDSKNCEFSKRELERQIYNGTYSKIELEHFIDSWWYNALTTITRDTFRKTIKKYRANNSLPGVTRSTDYNTPNPPKKRGEASCVHYI